MHKSTQTLRALAAMAFVALVSISGAAKLSLTVNTYSGTDSVTVDVDSETNFKFGEGTVMLNGQTPGSWAMKDVKSITFAIDSSSIGSVAADASELRVSKQGNIISIAGFNGDATSVRIYSVTGAAVYDNASWRGETIDVTSLDGGIYILKINDTTFKFLR